MDIELKTALDGIRSGVTAFEPRLSAMQKQLDAIDKSGGGRPGGGLVERKSLLDHMKESDQIGRLFLRDKRGTAVLRFEGDDALAYQQKTTITSAGQGYTTTGVLPIERLPGITEEARQALTLRDLLTATPTTFQVIDFVKVLQPLTIASPVPEAGTKPENQVTFTSVSERVKTIATWIPARL